MRYLLSFILLFVMGCQQSKTTGRMGQPHRDLSVVAPATVSLEEAENSLKSGQTSSANQIQIKKDSLKSTYMFSPSMIVSSNFPMLDLLSAKLVYFDRVGDQLGLFELRDSAVYDELADDILMETFEISSEDAQTITFKWDYGLRFLPAGPSWASSERPVDPFSLGHSEEAVLPNTASLIRTIDTVGEAVRIEQVSRFRGQEFFLNPMSMMGVRATSISTLDVTIRLFFEIKPYNPSPNFLPKASILDRGIGFFENMRVAPTTGKVTWQTQRWDSSSPIKYVVAKNVPADYRDAVKEGILYWNKAFGGPLIEVEMDVDPDEYPLDRRVMVQWAEWDGAGFARANLQNDPLTGEMIKGHVFMTSAFTNGGALIDRLEQEEIVDRPTYKVGLAGISQRHGCDYDLSQKIEDLKGLNLSAADRLRMAQDMVREVMAHEVGHTLGLRHNFASSLDASIVSQSDFELARDRYLAGQLPKGAATSASVMDYNGGFASALTGAYIKHHGLAYDELAMDWGYNNSSMVERNDKLAFCTDAELRGEGPIGCAAFDGVPEVFGAAKANIESSRKNVMFRFLNSLLMKVFDPEESLRRDVEEVIEEMGKMPLENVVASNLRALNNFLSMLREDRTILKVNEQIGPRSWLNQDEYDRKAVEFLENQLTLAGGLETVLQSSLPWENNRIKQGWLKIHAEQIIQSDLLTQGQTLQGVPYQLNADQRRRISKYLRDVAEKFEPIYTEAVLATITPEDHSNAPYRRDLSTLMEPVMERMVLSAFDRDTQETEVRNGSNLVLFKEAKWNADVRKSAIRLMDESRYNKTPSWMRELKKNLYQETRSSVQTLMQKPGMNSVRELGELIDQTDMDDDFYDLVDEEFSVLKAFEAYHNWHLE